MLQIAISFSISNTLYLLYAALSAYQWNVFSSNQPSKYITFTFFVGLKSLDMSVGPYFLQFILSFFLFHVILKIHEH